MDVKAGDQLLLIEENKILNVTSVDGNIVKILDETGYRQVPLYIVKDWINKGMVKIMDFRRV